jgi:hypothetical protein
METANTKASALVVAHPGHELRVHGWLTQSRPDVFILTDGSGHSAKSRLQSSARVLEETGASQGSIFGRFTDREIYAALLEQDVGLFADVAAELADALIARNITTVAGDAVEGYNPTHDMCRLIVDTAVLIVRRRGTAIENCDFAVVGAGTSSPTMTVELDRAMLDRKMRAAREYAEMESEVDAAIAGYAAADFCTERFRVRDAAASLAPPDAKPFYETHGERQVAAGFYRNVVRYREHVEPLNDAVLASADRLTCVR